MRVNSPNGGCIIYMAVVFTDGGTVIFIDGSNIYRIFTDSGCIYTLFTSDRRIIGLLDIALLDTFLQYQV